MAIENKEVNGLDDILKFLGYFGKYQIISLCLLCLISIFSGAEVGDYLFNASDIPIRCRVPECENATDITFSREWTAFTIPDDRKCYRYQPKENSSISRENSCSPGNFNSTLVACDDFVYGADNSMVYDFKFQCNDPRKPLIGTVSNLASFMVLPIVGILSDKYGRKPVLIWCSILRAILGTSNSFATSYGIFLAVNFVQSILGSGAFSTCYVLCVESVASKKRTLALIFIVLSFSIGQCIEALLAWEFPYWRILIRVKYVPQFVSIAYFFVIDDSVRWLISKGKNEEAIDVLNKAAKLNAKTIPEEMLKWLDKNTETSADATEKIPLKVLVKQVVTSSIMRLRILCVSVWWLCGTLLFYGLSINSVGLVGNMYVNISLVALMGLPGTLIANVTIDKFGRKKTLFTGFMFCSGFNVASIFIPKDFQNIKLIVYLLAKVMSSLSITTIYTYSAELYPTKVRHTLFAFSSTIGRIGSICAPQTLLLIPIWPSFPMIIFASMAFVSALLVLLMPETLGTDLPDTVEDAERMIKIKNIRL